jgi:hypothetical protein
MANSPSHVRLSAYSVRNGIFCCAKALHHRHLISVTLAKSACGNQDGSGSQHDAQASGKKQKAARPLQCGTNTRLRLVDRE